ncbi:MAG: acyltransferase [Balneolales bacterium]
MKEIKYNPKCIMAMDMTNHEYLLTGSQISCFINLPIAIGCKKLIRLFMSTNTGIFRKILNRFILKFAILVFQLKDKVSLETLPKFANQPKRIRFQLPRIISNPEYIVIGDDVKFGPGCMLKVSTKYPGSWMRHPEGKHISQTFNPIVVIGNNVTATSNLHMTATKNITIEDDVMFASNVFLADCSHGYFTADVPFKYQGLQNIAPIKIKSGAWICQNVVILPGVTIGENSIIGANSVVRTNIPAKCIAVGNPAKVIKKWDAETKTWKRIKKKVNIKI